MSQTTLNTQNLRKCNLWTSSSNKQLEKGRIFLSRSFPVGWLQSEVQTIHQTDELLHSQQTWLSWTHIRVGDYYKHQDRGGTNTLLHADPV